MNVQKSQNITRTSPFFGHNNKIHNSAENKRTKANYLNQKPKRLGERATVVLSEHQVLQSQKYHKIKPV